MLYLEDYLEMIEHLPQELRDRFTEMREMDLTVQNNMDALEKRVRHLFSQCRRGEMSHEQAQSEFVDIKKGYNKTLEEADEKVQLANQMYELVERYLRRLDTELHKFKCELEADNKGITEILEKRSLELDMPTVHQNNHYNKENRYRIKAEKRYDNWGGARDKLNLNNAGVVARNDSVLQATLGRDASSSGYVMSHASHPINTSVNQSLVVAHQQLPQGGRRATTMKASSFDAVTADGVRELGLEGHSLSGYVNQGTLSHGHQTVSHTGASTSSNKRHKKKASYSGSAVASRSSSPVPDPSVNTTVMTSIEEGLTDGEWTYDPNEPRYCICNQVSYGDMVACDNHECPYEWFHYPCVGITAPPKGKWYCPQCTTNMRKNRANNRKN